MKKSTIYISMIFVMLIGLMSCSSNPFFGEWKIVGNTAAESVMSIDNYDVLFMMDAEDGVVEIRGTYEIDSDDPNKIFINFDSSSIDVVAENPTLETILRSAAQEMCSRKVAFTLSEDGDKLLNSNGETAAVRTL